MTPFLEQTFRWFGPNDTIPLAHLRQGGATGIVTSLHHLPCGSLWSVEEIQKMKRTIEAAGMRWSVVESVPIHEDIKQRRGRYQEYIANYIQTIRNLAACDVRVICYNFMALKDWTRTDFNYVLEDGAEAIRYDAVEAAAFDLFILKRAGAEADHPEATRQEAALRFAKMSEEKKALLSRNMMFGLPGTVDDFKVEEFRAALKQYDGIDKARFRENAVAFLKEIIPVAEACGVLMAIHPDDPPFPVFGLPRIASTEDDLKYLFTAVDSESNGLTYCTGSLGANISNDLPGIIRRWAHRIHFLHLRNVRREADGSFHEAAHLTGSSDMAAVMDAVVDAMKDLGAKGLKRGWPLRPDHGHRMLDDLSKSFYPGYSAVGRLRGLAELRGLELGLRHAKKL